MTLRLASQNANGEFTLRIGGHVKLLDAEYGY